ncbi:MAG: hypothetical protein OXK77_09810 [Gemmatimonadota bacterium]|nr:hypothetical protein [Gemmatimonadota bacterium]MDE2865838.1 hypothetical protein [Gemmatimonadota bacterium]MYB08101.1 hypothetical protein [Gemmatimonadota bacterium]MYE16147.1 hypothetical protein [Gemmatimonadota bacterium]MYG23171.1 hypothetical protein [Gemmatimonadota bacterium]
MTRTLLPACLGALLIAPDGRAQETIELPGEDRPLAAELVEVYRVGSVDAVAEWQVLGTVPAAGFDEAGNLYFLDAPARVVVVDPGGNFLGQIGRPGEGPGEFRRAEQLDVFPSGRIVVTDPFSFPIFGADGVFERTVSVRVDRSDISEIGAFVRAASYGARPARDGAAIFSDGIRKIMRTDLSSEEARIDTFVEAWAPAGTEGVVSGSVADVMSGALWGLEPPLLFDALPGGGVVFSDSSAYAIKVTGPSGEVLRILRRPIDPEPATDGVRQAEKDRELAKLGLARDPSGRVPPDMVALAGVFRAAHARAIEDMRFFPEVPVLHALRTTWEGNLWVQRRGEEPEVDLGPIDVLTPAGRYLGTIDQRMRMPDEFGPDGLVVFLEKDEFDVPVVVVKRLPPGIR